jgi:hypothetical protein
VSLPDPVIARVPVGPVLRTFADTAWGQGTASFSLDEVFRYRLSRVWDESGPRVNFLMLNPSTADESVLDPTVRRCMGFARAWGMGACEVTNVFAYRSTDPAALRGALDPVGPGNDEAIVDAAGQAVFTVAAWGTHAELGGRNARVLELLRGGGVDVRALRVTAGGHPGHPLYLSAACTPVVFGPARATSPGRPVRSDTA